MSVGASHTGAEQYPNSVGAEPRATIFASENRGNG